jgi:RIO-like serine/threonine protein kinase
MSELQPSPKILKQDLFGRVELIYFNDSKGISQLAICRDLNYARWWVRPLANYLAWREVKALQQLTRANIAPQQLPQILEVQGGCVIRSYLPGKPLHQHGQPSAVFFEQLKQLLDEVHSAKVTHNDLAKEPNILVSSDGSPALIDMQLASRGRLFFKTQSREDLRHVLKHQRTYYPQTLSSDDLKRLANKSLQAKVWMRCVKPVYLFVTRRLLHWSDRVGAGDRNIN